MVAINYKRGILKRSRNFIDLEDIAFDVNKYIQREKCLINTFNKLTMDTSDNIKIDKIFKITFEPNSFENLFEEENYDFVKSLKLREHFEEVDKLNSLYETEILNIIRYKDIPNNIVLKTKFI